MKYRGCIATLTGTMLTCLAVAAAAELTVPVPDTRSLRREIEALREEIGILKREVDDLKAQLGAAVQTAALPIEPEFVFGVSGRTGYNHSNPIWSRDGGLLAFERTEENTRQIRITDARGTDIQSVAYRSGPDALGLDMLVPGLPGATSYNAALSWSPQGDRFIFMSNGAEGNYDLYLGRVGADSVTRLTHHPEKDGHADWSPHGDQVLFVSGETGKAQVYLLDLASRRSSRITAGDKGYLYPQWSPDGKRAALLYGSNDSHDIHLVMDLQRPAETLVPLTQWAHDDLRPIWSPDGSKIAFYTNYNSANDPKIWSIAVVDVGAPKPVADKDLIDAIAAVDVVPDIDRGPAWLPDSRRIAYVKNESTNFNPIHVVDTSSRRDRLLMTNTKINHDISCSTTGLIAFRSQRDQWDQIFITRLRDGDN